MSVIPPPEPPPADLATNRVETGTLDAEKGHALYYECHGALDALPVVILHGGPGSGSTPRHRDFFDAARYRCVQCDQRGCGRSTPAGETSHNDSTALIDDIERLRLHLGIDRWLVFGGSWGASLALAYAARHRDRVLGLVLRGAFLTGDADMRWFFHDAASLAPATHARLFSLIPATDQDDVPGFLGRSFAGDDAALNLRLANAWQAYEAALDGGSDNAAEERPDGTSAGRLVAKYRVQAHYLAQHCFLGESRLLDAARSCEGLPVAIVHGSEDRICPPRNSRLIHEHCDGSRLAWASGAGHHPWHPASLQLLRAATQSFLDHGDFRGMAPDAT